MSEATKEQYVEALMLLDSLRPQAEAIGRRLCPWARSAYVEDFDSEDVTLHCYWPNYETETIRFPAAWLFDPDWEARVDERLAQEKADKKAEKQKAHEDQTAKERREYERLRARFGETIQ